MSDEPTIKDVLGFEPKGDNAPGGKRDLMTLEEPEEPTPLAVQQDEAEEPSGEEEPAQEVAAEEPESPAEARTAPEEGEGEAEEEEDPYRVKIREANEKIAAALEKQQPVAAGSTPEVARLEGRLEELKSQIESHRAEPAKEEDEEALSDEELLSSPEVEAALRDAAEDPGKLGRALLYLSKRVQKPENKQAVEALQKEIADLKSGSQKSQQVQQATSRFYEGLRMAAGESEGAKALVQSYVDSGMDSKHILSVLFTQKREFLATPETMALGIDRLARDMGLHDIGEPAKVSRTAKGVRGKATLKGKQPQASEEEEDSGNPFDYRPGQKKKGRVNIPALAGP